MIQSPILDPVRHIRLLHAELRRVRDVADVVSTGATIHPLRNSVAAVARSLQLAEACIKQGDVADLDQYLERAEESLQVVRVLIVQARVATVIRQRQFAGVAQRHTFAGTVQQQPGRPARTRARIETWLTAKRLYRARYEVDEGGQLA